MTEKELKRAKEIKEELFYLRQIEQELPKCIRINIVVTEVESIRKPFISAVKEAILKLQEEFENL